MIYYYYYGLCGTGVPACESCVLVVLDSSESTIACSSALAYGGRDNDNDNDSRMFRDCFENTYCFVEDL